MNEEEFKKHLKDLVHGHHHPEEHAWAESGAAALKKAPVKKAAKTSKVKKPSGTRKTRSR